MEVAGAINGSHSSDSEDALNQIAAGEGRAGMKLLTRPLAGARIIALADR
jgi:hypothetical protein